MNDADNNNTDHTANVNQEAGWSKADDTKPNKNNRTSDIYERFLNRVQSIDKDASKLKADNVESFERVEKPSAYEPLNEEELRLFASHEQELDSNESDSTSIDISFSDDARVTDGKSEVTDLLEASTDDEPKHDNDTLATEPEINSSNKKTSALWGKQVSSGKLLTIGVVCGLLLSALVVVTLNVTGVLAALSNSLAPNSDHTAPVSTINPAFNSEREQATNKKVTTKTDGSNIDTANANDSGKAVAGTELSTESADSDILSVDATISGDKLETANAQKASSKEVPAQRISKQNQANNTTNNSTVAGTDISPEDFRKEAQNTLYRETND